ncbi:hypothetical protein KO481_35570 [Nocardia sp. NEAU-G5]|uniref:Uncharacterized protein n=1 Tax=Nocardia albiluteola TaxID=2842303 RepID=A0ABS6BAQ1_9NOCA|nr:hypothetical protein [Nocardia albiluteola]MBU3066826.1 hypothetical protein [Nocardia albiluteola]
MTSVELHEGLTGVASSHMQIAAGVGAAISVNRVPASPKPGALDVVTCMISQVMTAYNPTFFTPTCTAVGYQQAGSSAVHQANSTYHSTDASGGAEVASRDVFLRS